METNRLKKYRRVNIFIQSFGLGTVLLGCSAILGWLLGIPELTSFAPGKIPMSLSTASLFITYGLIIFLYNRFPSSRIVSWFGFAFNFVSILGALLLLYLSLSGIRPGVEHLGIKMNGGYESLNLGHMSPVTAFSFIMVGLSVLMVMTKTIRKIQKKTSLFFAALVFIISIIFLLSYIFGAPLLYKGSFIPPALTTSLAFLFLAIGLLLLSGLKVWPYEELSDALSTRYTYILASVFILSIITTITAGYSYYTMEQSEVYGPVRDRFWGIIILVTGLLIGSGVSVGLLWRQQRSKFTKERYQSTEKIRNLNRIYTVRSDINQAIVHFRNPQELFEKVCRIAVETGGFKMAWIGKFNLQTKKVDIIASEGIPEELFNKINFNYDDENQLGITGLSVKKGIHVISNDIQNDNLLLHLHKNAALIGYKSVGVFPLKVFEKVWGVFKLYSGEIGFFDEEELKLLDELTMDISFAIEFAEKEVERKLSEKALIESEKQFRSVVEEAVEIVFTVDNHGYFTYVNPAGIKSSGYSTDELKHFKYIDLIEPEYKHSVKRNYFKQYLDRRALSTTEYPFRSKTGEIKWFNQNTRLIIENDEVKGFYVIARDITEQRIAETALTESEERFRSLYENSTIGLYRTTPDGKIILANPTLIKMLGYSSLKEMTERNLEKDGFEPTYDRKQFLEQIEIHGEINGLESVWNIKDGSVISIRESSKAIRDSEGKTLYYDGTVEDITASKRAEKEFMMLAHSLKSVNEAVSITDMENRIIFVNESFLKTYGYKEKELDGKHISIIYPSYNRPELEEKILPTTLSGGWQGELWNKRKDGSEFQIYLSTTKIHDKDGKILGLIGVATNITERKRVEKELIEAKEKAEEMSRLKSNFLANMSHELRTPLVGIIGFADILRQETEDPELKERVEVIFKSGTRLSETLNLILDLSKFESEKMNFIYKEIDIVNETEDIISLFKETAIEKGLILKSSFSDPSIIINMDERAFHSILSNLINNALKFTTEGGIAVDISLKDNFVEIKVIDSGIGISNENHEVIFEEFRQVSEGLIRNFEGTGLGLNITKKLVEKLGGEISLFSEPGKGSTFTVKLPVTNSKELGEDKTVIEKARLTELAIQKSSKPIALLVDDDPIVYPVLKSYTRGQIDLEFTTDGEYAIKLCTQKQYAYIFMDINLRRGMDGVEVTKIIRKIKGYESVPIIATTAYAMAGDKEAFLAAGCSHYLSKPFNQQDIINLMEAISATVK